MKMFDQIIICFQIGENEPEAMDQPEVIATHPQAQNNTVQQSKRSLAVQVPVY